MASEEAEWDISIAPSAKKGTANRQIDLSFGACKSKFYRLQNMEKPARRAGSK